MTYSLSLIEKYKEKFNKKYKTDLSIEALWIRAIVLAIEDYPIINAVIEPDMKGIRYRDYVDIAFPFEQKGVTTHITLRDCDKMNIVKILSELRRCRSLVEKDQVALEDLIGGTISITNEGGNDSLLGSHFIDKGQTTRVGLNSITKKPFCVDNNPKKIEARDIMLISLSYDHRLIDGKDAVLFLKRLKELMEEPEQIVFNI